MTADRQHPWTRILNLFSSALPKRLLAYLSQGLQKSRLWLGLCGAIACFALGTVTSSAQQSTELPPPPPVAFPDAETQPSLPTAPLSDPFNQSFSSPAGMPLAPNATEEREASFQPSPDAPPAPLDRYLVYVNGDSPYLLQQVQMVAPTASVQQYRGQSVIQIGRFNDEATARQQIAALNTQGIRADLIVSDERSVSNAPGNASEVPAEVSSTNRYLVVIPADRQDMATLTEQVLRLGIQQAAIQQKSAPLGPHVQIGPYADRNQAEMVSHYLRQSGMDAIVVYRR